MCTGGLVLLGPSSSPFLTARAPRFSARLLRVVGLSSLPSPWRLAVGRDGGGGPALAPALRVLRDFIEGTVRRCVDLSVCACAVETMGVRARVPVREAGSILVQTCRSVV